MDADVKELLGLLVRAGELAARMLARAEPAEPKHIRVEDIPDSELIERGMLPIPTDIAEELELYERASAPPVAVPESFQVGRVRFADSYPQRQKWFTNHAREELIARYRVSPAMAYRTLQHVHRSIKEQGAVFLYRRANVDVYAVDVFQRVALVAVDTEDGCLVTFLPPEARDNGEIAKYPEVRARLESFERSLTPRAVAGWGTR